VVIHVSVDPGIPPRPFANKGDVMKTLTYAAVVLAAIAGAAPAMAQVVQPDAPFAVQAQPPLDAQAPGPVAGWAGMPSAADGMYNAYGQPNQVYGMPGAGQVSASSHPAP
jgi:hypothetical protein